MRSASPSIAPQAPIVITTPVPRIPPAATVPSIPPAATVPSMPSAATVPSLPTAGAAPSPGVRTDGARVQELLSDLMSARKELTEKSTELRKVVNERNTLRARLTFAERTARELSSAFRAEAQLRSEFIDTHATSSASLRARVSELETALAASKLEHTNSEQLGLRRIRGIGPAFERALLGLGITAVAQIAALSAEDIARLAPQIKARADRIQRDDWVGQAQRLLAEVATK